MKQKSNLIIGVLVILIITLFFFPEPETNWIAYFSVMAIGISLITYLSLKK